MAIAKLDTSIIVIMKMMMQAMQLMGQEGMVRGNGVERNYRDARWPSQYDDDHVFGSPKTMSGHWRSI